MKYKQHQNYAGERACFASHDVTFDNCTFADGESPLKESDNIILLNSRFEWKYPLWYCHDVKVASCALTETARAGIWYTRDIEVSDCLIQAPKTFRRCRGLSITRASIPNAAETLWNCDKVTLRSLTVRHGDYFAMNCGNMDISELDLEGNYAFDGARNVVIRNSRLITKDAFWNSENVTVYDSHIEGEYLGWNSKNLTLVNCTISSNQGMCYCDNIVLKNCRATGTTLAFEYSTVDAEIASDIDSVFNPKSGRVRAEEIGELIVETDIVDPKATQIDCERIHKRSAKPDWK